MTFVVKNDLQSFADKLNTYKVKGDLAEKIAEKVANKGVEIAQNNWGNQASVVKRGNKLQKSIVAIDNNKIKPSIAYTEFGTGIQGEGKYEGELPIQNITFTDKSGLQWTTQGWEYHYRYNQTQQGKPYKGQTPKMPMFNTAKELREYINTELAKDIRKGD